MTPGQASSRPNLALLQQYLAEGSGQTLLAGCVMTAHATTKTCSVGEICSGRVAPVRALADHNPGAHSRKCKVAFAGKRLDVVRKLQDTYECSLESMLHCWAHLFISSIVEAATDLSSALEVC